MIGALAISNDAANLAAAALSPEIPDNRVYVDERDEFTLPHALVYVEAVGPAGSVMYDGTLVVHVWARSLSAAAQLAERMPAALVGFHALADGAGYRVKRGQLTYLREDDAAHYTWRLPLRYDAKV